MKKIDLHIHTIKTRSDSDFEFSLEKFSEYVRTCKLDAVAVTNHDIFEISQYNTIRATIGILTLPGIEINCENGHLLVMADPDMVVDFAKMCSRITEKITKVGDKISFEELERIFGNLNRYILIPHYDKKPPIHGKALEKIFVFSDAGEVDSPKKFVRRMNLEDGLTPVLFSDVRISTDLSTFPTRQTYIDCGDLSVNSIKSCLRDRRKVKLSAEDGNKLFQVLQDGTKISTGLNVLFGERSSGKTYMLNQIDQQNDNVKYIKQFSLVQKESEADEREFNESVEGRRKHFVENYLQEFKHVVEKMEEVDLKANDRKINAYVESLLKSAHEIERQDSFSRCSIFRETDFSLESDSTLKSLIASVEQIIENVEYRDVIEKHIKRQAAISLMLELIPILRTKDLQNRIKVFVNAMVKDIKLKLRLKTSATQVTSIDLYGCVLDMRRVKKFNELVRAVQSEQIVFSESIQTFKVTATKKSYVSVGDIKKASGTKLSFSEAFRSYGSPFDFLQSLKAMPELSIADHFRLFAKIEYRILNKDGADISGGERSEFRLLQEIREAQNYDLLLVDEPESSFDNLFLKGQLNEIIKDISQTMPVIIVTHNNTVGAFDKAQLRPLC